MHSSFVAPAPCRAAAFRRRAGGLFAAAALLVFTAGAPAQTPSPAASVFVQAGTVASTHSASIGLTRDWSPGWAPGPGRLGGYWEGSVAEWFYPEAGGDHRHLIQLGVKPVLRYGFDGGASRWFVEAGVGLTVTSRRYRSEAKAFSTAFNFGDHLAVGRAFGDDGRHELALRIEHFSNGGIREPNPGKTFGQLRYAYRF